MNVRIVPFKRADAAWNLALEEGLFLKAKQDLLEGKEVQPIVKMYSFSRPSVILGYKQRIEEIDYDFCKNVGVDVTMRTTGGGSVYLGKDDVQYSLLLPTGYSKELLQKINSSIVQALQDVGFNPQLQIKNLHHVIRLEKKSFVFDAQRRFKNVILHHGTTLVNNDDYEHMPEALRATPEEIRDLQAGNVWLRDVEQIREKALVKSFEKNLPQGTSVVRKDFTAEEIKIAKELYKKFYTNEEALKGGKKAFGICYLPSTIYDMELYAEEDSV